MDKEQLKKKLEEVKVKIKTNSKDAHFADTLIDEILSIKGQLDVEPTIVHIEEKDVVQSFDGGNFTMSITNRGDAVYHVKGGYTLVADYRMVGLSKTIAGYVLDQDVFDTLNDDEKELVSLDMSATTLVLNAPIYAFSSEDLKYDLATMLVKFLREEYDKYIENPLQDENVALDLDFEEKEILAEEFKDAIESSGIS